MNELDERTRRTNGMVQRNEGIEREIRVFAHVAQAVERVLGKDEVSGSTPLVGSISIGKEG
jgi:hypothetical protein